MAPEGAMPSLGGSPASTRPDTHPRPHRFESNPSGETRSLPLLFVSNDGRGAVRLFVVMIVVLTPLGVNEAADEFRHVVDRLLDRFTPPVAGSAIESPRQQVREVMRPFGRRSPFGANLGKIAVMNLRRRNRMARTVSHSNDHGVLRGIMSRIDDGVSGFG